MLGILQKLFGKAKLKGLYVYLILKPDGQSCRSPDILLLSEAKPSYVYSILKPPDQSFKSSIRLLLYEAKPSYI